MTHRIRLISISAWLLLLAGCAGTLPAPSPNPPTNRVIPQAETPPPMTTRKPGEDVLVEPLLQTMQVPKPEPIPAPETKPVMSGNHAVIALLDVAQNDAKAGKRDAAGASLERALRIEPRNPWLWHELGQLRLNQGQYAQAISLAQKSNSFAGHERHLQALNWRLIGNARAAQGDSAGAEHAFQKAAEFEQ